MYWPSGRTCTTSSFSPTRKPWEREGEPRFHRGPPNAWLEAGDVLGLQTLGSFADLEFNGLALAKRLVPIRLYGGVMYEDVLAGLALDEPVALACGGTLFCFFFFYFFSLFFSYFVL